MYRDAWNRLGDMSQEDAMTRYVDEMKKVLSETYPDGYDAEEVNTNNDCAIS